MLEDHSMLRPQWNVEDGSMFVDRISLLLIQNMAKRPNSSTSTSNPRPSSQLLGEIIQLISKVR
jgi:hypothetical protein